MSQVFFNARREVLSVKTSGKNEAQEERKTNNDSYINATLSSRSIDRLIPFTEDLFVMHEHDM